MASGTRKRQYQPSLTSYFPTLSERRSSGNTLSPAPSTHATYAPAVPSAVQSSLLNVGMRVRKAVPEGYKTKSALAPETHARSEQQVKSASDPFRFEVDQENNNYVNGVPRPDAYRRGNELLPFCGVHKVGGWGIQDSFETSSPLPALSFEDTPFSSQESNESSFSTDSMPAALNKLQRPIALHSKKRQLDGHEDHYGSDDTELDSDYPVFTIFTEEEDATMMDRRRIARPVTRRKIALPSRHVPNVHSRENAGSAEDFEEASFLEPHGGGADSEMGVDEW